MSNRDFVKDVLLGVSIGDALGVPVEFVSRARLALEPVTSMRAYGAHHQPSGTWSDDSSLTFCLAEMLCGDYDLQNLANRFVNWKEYAYWTAHGRVFDIGIATSSAIHDLGKGVAPSLAGGHHEDSNGNGSLMRILPLIFYLQGKPLAQRFNIVNEVSSLTHRHIRSVIACFIYTEFALQLLEGKSKDDAYKTMQIVVNDFLKSQPICSMDELNKFHRILENQVGNYAVQSLHQLSVDEIHSSGYVLNTLEASLWCILKTDSYREAVLKAVNLGHDTDTTGAVTGGLAGLIYEWKSIPDEWLNVLVKRKEIEQLSDRLSRKIKV